MPIVCALFGEPQISRSNYGEHPTCKNRKARHRYRGSESPGPSRSPSNTAIKRTSVIAGLFACLAVPNVFSHVVTPTSEELAEAEKGKWNIPERLRIGPDQAYGNLSASAKPCVLCIRDWQAIDIAKAYLEEYPIKYLNVRAEYMEDFPWSGKFRAHVYGTDTEWYFGDKIGLQYSGDFDSPSQSSPPETEPRAGTWRV